MSARRIRCSGYADALPDAGALAVQRVREHHRVAPTGEPVAAHSQRDLASAPDASVPPGSVFVPYAFAEVELNRLGAPSGAGLRVTARKAPSPQLAGAAS